MIRFENGQPKSIWYSQHEYGAAYTYDAVEKIGKRPVAYSAKGSHANYAVPGKHDLHETSKKPHCLYCLFNSNRLQMKRFLPKWSTM